jgi:hypothetical protein
VTRIIRLSVSLIGLISLSALVIWFAAPLDYRAFSEAFRPTTVEMLPIPDGCVPTDVPPPAPLMQVVDRQRICYRLRLQKVFVCKTQTRLTPDFRKEMLHGAGTE